MKHPAVDKFKIVLGSGVERLEPSEVDDVGVVENHIRVNQDAWVSSECKCGNHEQQPHIQKFQDVVYAVK